MGEGGRAEKKMAEGKPFCRTDFKEHPGPIYTNILALNLSVWRGEAENERKKPHERAELFRWTSGGVISGGVMSLLEGTCRNIDRPPRSARLSAETMFREIVSLKQGF